MGEEDHRQQGEVEEEAKRCNEQIDECVICRTSKHASSKVNRWRGRTTYAWINTIEETHNTQNTSINLGLQGEEEVAVGEEPDREKQPTRR